MVAGALKRADRQRPEEQVLMRALRDFNIPKIVTEDVPIFMGLIGTEKCLDLPSIARKTYENLMGLMIKPLNFKRKRSSV